MENVVLCAILTQKFNEVLLHIAKRPATEGPRGPSSTQFQLLMFK